MARQRRNAAWDALTKAISPVIGTNRVMEKTDAQVQIELAINKFRATAPLTAQIEAFTSAITNAFLVGNAMHASLDLGDKPTALKEASIDLFDSESPLGTHPHTEMLKLEEEIKQAPPTNDAATTADAAAAAVKPAESTDTAADGDNKDAGTDQ